MTSQVCPMCGKNMWMTCIETGVGDVPVGPWICIKRKGGCGHEKEYTIEEKEDTLNAFTT